MQTKILALQEKQWFLDAEQVELGKRLLATPSATSQELSSQVGLTKQQMVARAAQLERQKGRSTSGRHTEPAKPGVVQGER